MVKRLFDTFFGFAGRGAKMFDSIVYFFEWLCGWLDSQPCVVREWIYLVGGFVWGFVIRFKVLADLEKWVPGDKAG